MTYLFNENTQWFNEYTQVFNEYTQLFNEYTQLFNESSTWTKFQGEISKPSLIITRPSRINPEAK